MKINMPASPIRCLLVAAVVCPGAAGEVDPVLLDPVEQGVADVSPLSRSLRLLELNLQEPIDFAEVYRVPGRPDWLMRASGALFAVFPQSVYEQTPAGSMPLIPNNTIFYIGQASLADLPQSPPSWQPGAATGSVRIEPRLERRWNNTLFLPEDLAIEESRPRVERPVLSPETSRADGPNAGEAAETRGEAQGYRSQAAMRRSAGPAALPPQATTEQLPPDTIEGDAEYRAKRVRSLMERAAGSERGGNAGADQ